MQELEKNSQLACDKLNKVSNTSLFAEFHSLIVR